MDCTEAQQNLSAYVDGETDPSISASYEQHLTSCDACRRAYENLLQLRGSLRNDATIYAAPDYLRSRLQAELRPNKSESKIRRMTDRKFSWAWLNAGLAGAGSLAFAVTLSLYLALPGQAELVNQEIVASHYRSLLANHLADVASSDHHTVKPWFTGKLDYAPAVNDFSAEGFPLIGGRLDYINKRTVAALAYRHNNHLINVFMWPDSSTGTASGKATTLQGFNLLQWNDAGMTYRAVSDMNSEEMKKLRELLVASNQK